MTNKRQIAGVVGAGALGTLFAYELARVCDVVLLVRREQLAAVIERDGLRVDAAPPRPVRASIESSALSEAAVVFLATKAYDVESALGNLRGVTGPGVPIVSLPNGLDNVSRIERVLGAEQPIVAAPTSEAASLIEPGRAVRNGIGTTVLGAGNSSGAHWVDAVASLLRAAALNVDVREPIAPWIWAKAIGNVAINPVGALFDLENGAILEDERARDEAFALAREAAAVAVAEGVTLPFRDPVHYVEQLARATRHNRSSMWYDLRRGGPTEIDALCGAVCERGARVHVPTPRNCAVRDEVNRRCAPYGSGNG